jgi:DNA repair protein RadD
MQLYPFQSALKTDTHREWNAGARNVLAVAPTGSGKTVFFSDMITSTQGAVCAIAHRQELVGQMSLSLARFGVHHRVIGPRNVVRMISQLHSFVLGKCFYDPHAEVAVAGVNTLVRRGDSLRSWLPKVDLWVLDEAHHLLSDNVWGKAVGMFPNARGLGVTATPCRADGAGLGRHADGLFDKMVIGPTGRELIQQGFLSDYRIFAPPNDIDFSNVNISKTTGDYVKNQAVKATAKSHIIGDIVQHYLRIAPGKLGVTFVPSTELAADVSTRFNAAGVPAKVVTAKTPDIERVKILHSFAAGDLKQLVNVDLFGEGFDLPTLEVVSMGRKTESFSLYSQQFGRVLRRADGKTHGTIIDHVGNVMRHGLPDAPQAWTLDRRERTRSAPDPDLIPTRTCVGCTAVYEAWAKVCPYCGEIWKPIERATPEQVEGDLEELDPAVLAAMREEVARIDEPADNVKNRMKRAGASHIAVMSAAKNHRVRQEAQAVLRNNIAQWAGYHKVAGKEDFEIRIRFFRQFGIDIESAKALGRPDAEKLNNKVVRAMG